MFFFYRIQEHGVDRSAQILVLILTLYLLSLINFDKNFEKNLIKIFIVSGIIISLKALYLLYLAVSIPIIYIFFKEKKFFYILHIFKNKFFWLFILLLSNVLLVYFINTGCLIYPATSTCFENFSWSLSLAEVEKMNIHYEAWSKGGKNPNFVVENPAQHIEFFNWVPLWIEIYFFNKVSDFILGLIFLVIFITIIFYKKSRLLVNINKNSYYIIFFILVFFFEWFYNHPSLRYGGYCLIAILLFFPFSIFLSRYNNSIKELKFKFILIICIAITIFIGRNISRIYDEMDKYNYKPLYSSNYKVEKIHFRIDDQFNNLIRNFTSCESNEFTCQPDLNPKMKKKFKNTIIFISDK